MIDLTNLTILVPGNWSSGEFNSDKYGRVNGCFTEVNGTCYFIYATNNGNENNPEFSVELLEEPNSGKLISQGKESFSGKYSLEDAEGCVMRLIEFVEGKRNSRSC